MTAEEKLANEIIRMDMCPEGKDPRKCPEEWSEKECRDCWIAWANKSA
jgi:hypothetical protein